MSADGSDDVAPVARDSRPEPAGGSDDVAPVARDPRPETADVPARYRVTPEALASYAEPREGSRSPLPASAYLKGGLVAWLVFPVASLAWLVADLPRAELGEMGEFVAYALLFSLPVVVGLAVPLAVLTSMALRRVAGQWWHVAAFGLLGAVVSLVGLVPWGLATVWPMVLAAALAGAVGRLAVWRQHRAAR